MNPSGKERSVKKGYSNISGPSRAMVVFDGSLLEDKNGVVDNDAAVAFEDEVTKRKQRVILY